MLHDALTILSIAVIVTFAMLLMVYLMSFRRKLSAKQMAVAAVALHQFLNTVAKHVDQVDAASAAQATEVVCHNMLIGESDVEDFVCDELHDFVLEHWKEIVATLKAAAE